MAKNASPQRKPPCNWSFYSTSCPKTPYFTACCLTDSVPDQGLSAIHNRSRKHRTAVESVPDQGLSAIHNRGALLLLAVDSVPDQGLSAIHNGMRGIRHSPLSVPDQGLSAIHNWLGLGL